jgi:anti-sigma factor RsiW
VTCPTHEMLSLLHDGELSARERAALEPHLRSCARCAEVLQSLSALTMLTRSAFEAELAQVSFAGLTARVMHEIEAERPVAIRERVRVWFEEFMANRRRVWVPAMALALVVVVLGGLYELQPAATPPEPGGSAVVSISADTPAIVFDIPSQDGLSSTAVVWVNDEPSSAGGSGT